MKLFTKETLTHPSLYQLKVTHGTEGNWRAGEGGERVFFCILVCLVLVSFLECALVARSSKEGKSQPARERVAKRAGCR